MNHPAAKMPRLGLRTRWWLAGGLLVLLVAWGVSLSWPRGEALHAALNLLLSRTGSDEAAVARAIWDNHLETRRNAALWSGAYFGFTFLAAACSALAGLILKFEFIVKPDALKKDLAALLSVLAAVLITISTSGDFHRKWQANRIAAAELEHLGYQLLEQGGTEAKPYFNAIAKVLRDRHLAVVGGSPDARARPTPPAASSAPPARAASAH